MRITFILPTATLGGGTRVVGIYARELMRMGHTVRLISPPRKTEPLRQKVKSWLRGGGLPIGQTAAPSHLDGCGLDHRILEVWRPVADDDVPDADVVVATWWETAEWVNALSARKGAKVYFIQHHEVFPYLPVERSRATYRLPMHKIVIARWLRQVMEREYSDMVVDLVPNSVDKAQFFAPVRGKQSAPTVGLLYASATFKGLDVSISSLEILRKKMPKLRIISFGSESTRADFLLPQGAEFFFSPAQDRIRELYARCDLWLTASRSEGFNLPAMEAMACRTPVVATRTGWPEEAVKTGWNGVLVDIDDTAALAQAVEWVLVQSDESWRTLSSNAYATVASSSWQESAALFENALKHACRRAARGEIAGQGAAVGFA